MSLLTQWLESLAETIEINDRCLRKVSPFSQCTACIEQCQEGAITLLNGKPVIHESKCTACTKCITACVVHAVEGSVPKREVIQDTLVYHPSMAPSRIELLYYYKRGIGKIASSEELPPSWKQGIDQANAYITAMGYEPIDIVQEKPERPAAEYTRRDLFRYFAKESKELALSSFTPAKWRYNHTVFSLNRAYPNWNFYRIALNKDNCTVCEVCFKLCPEKVFTVQEGSITIEPSKCNGCSLCIDVCQEKGILVREEVQPKRIIEEVVYSGTCSVCGGRTLSWVEDDTKCFVCKRKTTSRLF